LPPQGIIGSGGGSWHWVDSSKSSHEFSVCHLLVQRLLFFIRVVKDDDLAVTRRPEDIAVEVAKKFLGKNSAS
jgi:hypothetical protein